MIKKIVTFVFLAIVICGGLTFILFNAASVTDKTVEVATPISVLPTAIPSLKTSIELVLGKSNRGLERITKLETGDNIYIQWSINDNLSEDLIRNSAKLDIRTILRKIVDYGIDYESITLEGTFSMRDVYGNVNEIVVTHSCYEHSELEKVKWDTFDFMDVYKIASDYDLVEAFKEKLP